MLWKGKETAAVVRCSCARGRLLTDRENEERRKEERPELRLAPGIKFLDEFDRDLADMHGFEVLPARRTPEAVGPKMIEAPAVGVEG